MAEDKEHDEQGRRTNKEKTRFNRDDCDVLLKNMAVKDKKRETASKEPSKNSVIVDHELLYDINKEHGGSPEVDKRSTSSEVVHDSSATHGKITHDPPPRNEPKNTKIRVKLVGQKKPMAKVMQGTIADEQGMDAANAGKKNKRKRAEEGEVFVRRTPTFTLNPRHSTQQIKRFIKGINNQAHKRQAIVDMGFGGLLHIDFPRNNPTFAGDLVMNFDTNSICILLERNKEIRIVASDVHLVYGIPLEGHKIIEAKDDEEGFRELIDKWKAYHESIDVPSLTEIVTKLVTDDVDDNWKRSFLVLAVNSCIKSTTNTQPFLRFLSTSYDTNRIPNFNWCQYALESLVDGTLYWKCDTTRYFPGPLPFLMVCYFDRLKRQTFDPPRTFPLISSWNKNVVKERVALELKFGFGLGLLLERIETPSLGEEPQQLDMQHHPHDDERLQHHNNEQEHNQNHQDPQPINIPTNMKEFMQQFGEVTTIIANGFVKLTNLLAVGEQLSPLNIFKEDMAFNLAKMWSRCSSTQLPSEFQVFTQQTGSRSLLSQDNDMYSSIWFANIMDDIVRKETGEDQISMQNQVPQQVPILDQSYQQADTNFEYNRELRVDSSSPVHMLECDPTYYDDPLKNDELVVNEKICDNVPNCQDQGMEEHVDYEKCNGKRARKLPSIFRSPFLVQYSHLMIGKEKERNRILDYAFCLELDGDEELYEDGVNLLIRDYFKTMGANVFICNDVIDSWAYILNERDKIRKRGKRMFFPTETFNFLIHIDETEGISQNSHDARLQSFKDSCSYNMEQHNISSLKGYSLVIIFLITCLSLNVKCISLNLRYLTI
ncbi:uncharacterized protein [Spinacia oleracea]|uniref:Uncharacterized protein isoform X3 n=1 Tax=Spinacia oleracea TaxID=3562 RepID=A0ABM3R7D2_SPIOL|nr:uncharacterized protein LOC110791587 isoform X3 [Spinacia oleracea]